MIDIVALLLPMTLGLVPIAFVLAHPFSRTTLYARIATRDLSPRGRAEALRRRRQEIYLQMGDFHYRTEHYRTEHYRTGNGR